MRSPIVNLEVVIEDRARGFGRDDPETAKLAAINDEAEPRSARSMKTLLGAIPEMLYYNKTSSRKAFQTL